MRFSPRDLDLVACLSLGTWVMSMWQKEHTLGTNREFWDALGGELLRFTSGNIVVTLTHVR